MAKYVPTFDDLGIDSYLTTKEAKGVHYGDMVVAFDRFDYGNERPVYEGTYLGYEDNSYFDDEDGKIVFSGEFILYVNGETVSVPDYYAITVKAA